MITLFDMLQQAINEAEVDLNKMKSQVDNPETNADWREWFLHSIEVIQHEIAEMKGYQDQPWSKVITEAMFEQMAAFVGLTREDCG